MGPVAVAMALARSIPALVVAAIERVPHLALQGLLDDQPGRQLDQLRATGWRCEPSFNQGREGFTGAHRGRYPRPHGVLLWAWAGSAEPGLIIHPKDAPHPEFPATLGLHREAIAESYSEKAQLLRLLLNEPSGLS